MAPPKILLIDDDLVVRTAMVQFLADLGYQVVVADDGERGLRLFRSEKPDLVITDIIMPEKEGIQTIVEMRREQPSTKIIAISGGGRIGNADFLKVARSMGANDVIAKPVDPDDFAARIKRCLST
jgi:DNA-binding response OmpR family regulator